MFSYGEFKQEDQEKMLEQLNKKVEEVYRSCIGDNEANIRLVGLSTSSRTPHRQLSNTFLTIYECGSKVLETEFSIANCRQSATICNRKFCF